MIGLLFHYLERKLAMSIRRRIDYILTECQSVKAELSGMKEELTKMQGARYLEYAGDKVEVMLTARESAEQFMYHEDPRVRFTALDIILSFWGVTEKVVEYCKALALEECDIEVRQVALLSVGKYYEGTNDNSVGALLAKIASDEGASMNVRELAYSQLCRIAGIPWSHRRFVGECFPENMDSALLGRFEER